MTALFATGLFQDSLTLNGSCGVGDKAEALLGDELTGYAADAVSLVLNAHKGSLKVLDELVLPLGKGSGFLL